MNNINALLTLIKENPQLPVIPLICNSFADYYNLYSDYTIGCIETSFISKYCYFDFSGTKEFIIYEDKDIIEDYLTKYSIQNCDIFLDKIN